ncbi:MAG TPA: AtpZ/AtpI family protein [Candidatus Dormibacteraeota bacterium]|nr:AtpZ/AtpI family protein [Candidatus Dormibacteraeota bacterium]
MSSEGDPRRPKRVPGPGDALALVGVFSITVGSGVVAGVLLDEHFRTLPLLTFVGLVLGFVGGSLAVYRGLAPFRGR